MSKCGLILLVEDDEDDQMLFQDIVKDIGVLNEVITFSNADNALQFLHSNIKPIFIIFSDINMPKRNGLQFKLDIETDKKLKSKCAPFVFLSTSAVHKHIELAYNKMNVQGFFTKKNDYEGSKSQIKTILEYWKDCKTIQSK